MDLSLAISFVGMAVAIGGVIVSAAKYQEKVDTSVKRFAEVNQELTKINEKYDSLRDAMSQERNANTEKFTRMETTMGHILEYVKDIKEQLRQNK